MEDTHDTQVSLQSFPVTDENGASKFVRNEFGQNVASHHFGGMVLSNQLDSPVKRTQIGADMIQ